MFVEIYYPLTDGRVYVAILYVTWVHFVKHLKYVKYIFFKFDMNLNFSNEQPSAFVLLKKI